MLCFTEIRLFTLLVGSAIPRLNQPGREWVWSLLEGLGPQTKSQQNYRIQEMCDAYTSVEHSHSISLADLGQDYGLWNLQKDTGHLFKNSGWHNLLPSPEAARITAKGNESPDLVYQSCRYLGPQGYSTRNSHVGNTVPRLVRTL